MLVVIMTLFFLFFFFSSRRRHTRSLCDWSSDVCSSDLFGDKGYLSQPLAQQLLVSQGLHLITKLRKKMHNRLLDWSDKLLLRKRAIIETITDQLKNISQIEHSRHRSPINFLVNLIAGLIAYCHQPKKPSLGVQLPTLPQP